MNKIYDCKDHIWIAYKIESVISMIVGLCVGSLLFAKPDMSPLISSLPYSGDLFVSFYLAFISSTLTSLSFYVKNKYLTLPLK